MVKVLENKYPLGTLPNQRTAGRYMDEILKSNIDLLAFEFVVWTLMKEALNGKGFDQH